MDNQENIPQGDGMAQDQLIEAESALKAAELEISMLEEQIKKKREELENDRKKVADFREFLRRRASAESQDAPAISQAEDDVTKDGTVRAVMRATIPVVAKMHPHFGTKHLIKFWYSLPAADRPRFDIKTNKGNISRAMKRFWHEGIIQQVEEPAGRRQALYRLAK